MATELTKKQFIKILLDEEITKPEDLKVFQTIYSFEGHKAPASQVGKILGIGKTRPASPLNSQIGRLAKRVAKKHDIDFTVRANQKYKFWDVFFDGEEDGKFWIWQLKANLKEALEETGLTNDSPDYIDDLEEKLFSKSNNNLKPDSDILKTFQEGNPIQVVQTRYERNREARRACIKHWGTSCQSCELDFQKKYGELGEGFIHVHHLNYLSESGESRNTNPVEDLRPVCPNCHAMLHKGKLTIEELKKIISI